MIKKRSLLLVYLVSGIIFIACKKETKIPLIKCVTGEAINVSFTQVTLTGAIENYTGDESVDDICFYFSDEAKDLGSLVNDRNWILVGTLEKNNGSFSKIIDNLEPNHDYYFVASVMINGEELFGEVKSFSTNSIVLVTDDAEDITVFYANLHGHIENAPPDIDDSSIGFEFTSTNDFLEFNNVKRIMYPAEDVKNGFFNRKIECINAETCYFRACIKYKGKMYYGNTNSFDIPPFNVKVETGEMLHVDHRIAFFSCKVPKQVFPDSCWVTIRPVVDPSYDDLFNSSFNAPNVCYLVSNDRDIYIFHVSDLFPGFKYAYRAEIACKNRCSYGEVKSFSTPKYEYDKGEAVDLGLSVKWCSTNVGAPAPELYGLAVAWGDVNNKDRFGWNSYRLCNGSQYSLIKYNNDANYGTVDNKYVLELEDDIAYVQMGERWRIPTIEEVDELINNCIWTWISEKGKEGYRVSSRTNGNSIFLPATGMIDGSFYNSQNVICAGEWGYYWSSSLYKGIYSQAMYFTPEKYRVQLNGERYRGYYVRPVLIKP